MKSVNDLLLEADPVRHEGPVGDDERGRRRRIVVAAASADGPARPALSSRRVVPAFVVLAAIAAMAVVVSKGWLGGSTTLQAAVRFEVRMAETQPAAGLTEATIASSGNRVYLHPEVVVTNEDISGASVVPHPDGSGFDIGISFNAAGTAKMRAATSSHMGQPLAILIDGDVVAAPTVRASIGDKALITGRFTRAEAERIANGVLVR